MTVEHDPRDLVALQRRLIQSERELQEERVRRRDADARFRELFHNASDALLLVDRDTQRVLDCNACARTLHPGSRGRRSSVRWTSFIDPLHVARAEHLLADAPGNSPRSPPVVRLRDGREALLTVARFDLSERNLFLVRLTMRPTARAPAARVPSAGGRRATAGATATPSCALLQQFVEQSPDGIALCDGQARVLVVNRAFRALAELKPDAQAQGQPLSRWLGQLTQEFDMLIDHLRGAGTVALHRTVMRGERGTTLAIEISGAVLRDEGGAAFGFLMREVHDHGRPDVGQVATALGPSVSVLRERLGSAPLVDIVAEAVDVIERQAVRSALDLAGGNRAAAARLLGLSRQSLYVKLRRFGVR